MKKDKGPKSESFDQATEALLTNYLRVPWKKFYLYDSPDSDPPYGNIEIELNGCDGAVLEEPGSIIEVL